MEGESKDKGELTCERFKGRESLGQMHLSLRRLSFLNPWELVDDMDKFEGG